MVDFALENMSFINWIAPIYSSLETGKEELVAILTIDPSGEPSIFPLDGISSTVDDWIGEIFYESEITFPASGKKQIEMFVKNFNNANPIGFKIGKIGYGAACVKDDED